MAACTSTTAIPGQQGLSDATQPLGHSQPKGFLVRPLTFRHLPGDRVCGLASNSGCMAEQIAVNGHFTVCPSGYIVVFIDVSKGVMPCPIVARVKPVQRRDHVNVAVLQMGLSITVLQRKLFCIMSKRRGDYLATVGSSIFAKTLIVTWSTSPMMIRSSKSQGCVQTSVPRAVPLTRRSVTASVSRRRMRRQTQRLGNLLSPRLSAASVHAKRVTRRDDVA